MCKELYFYYYNHYIHLYTIHVLSVQVDSVHVYLHYGILIVLELIIQKLTYCIRSIRRHSQIVAALPDELNEIDAAID